MSPKRLTKRLDGWAERSRLNPYRLLVMRHPRLTEADRAAFDRLLAETAEGADIAYDLPQPKWWFLHHAASSGFLLHGTNEPGLDLLGTRATYDALGAPLEALFASDDAIWPLYFATVRRGALRYGYINWAVRVRNSSRYVFSIGADPCAPESWSEGTIYLVPAGPFRRQTIEHGAGDTPGRVVLRHAVRRSAVSEMVRSR